MKEWKRSLWWGGIGAVSGWMLTRLIQASFPADIREQARMQNGGRCNRCNMYVGNNGDLQLHHKLPESIAQALKLPTYVYQSQANAEPLCEPCHSQADAESFAELEVVFDQLAEEYPEILDRKTQLTYLIKYR